MSHIGTLDHPARQARRATLSLEHPFSTKLLFHLHPQECYCYNNHHPSWCFVWCGPFALFILFFRWMECPQSFNISFCKLQFKISIFLCVHTGCFEILWFCTYIILIKSVCFSLILPVQLSAFRILNFLLFTLVLIKLKTCSSRLLLGIVANVMPTAVLTRNWCVLLLLV